MEDDDLAQVSRTPSYKQLLYLINPTLYRSEKHDSSNSRLKAAAAVEGQAALATIKAMLSSKNRKHANQFSTKSSSPKPQTAWVGSAW